MDDDKEPEHEPDADDRMDLVGFLDDPRHAWRRVPDGWGDDDEEVVVSALPSSMVVRGSAR